MESVSLTHLSPEEEITLEWDPTLLSDKGTLLMNVPMEQEIPLNQTQAMETENFVNDDDNEESFESGQRITTQDLPVPELSMECTPARAKNPKKKTQKRT